MSAASDAEEAAREEMDAARLSVMKNETDIQTIKSALRKLTDDGGEDSDSKGFLKFSALKVKQKGEDISNEEMPLLKLLLSSPIDEQNLSKLADPLLEETEALQNGSKVKFEDVETSAATLTVSVYDKKSKAVLGVSANHDVAPLCEFDVMAYIKKNDLHNPVPGKVTELEVAIVPETPHAMSSAEKAAEKAAEKVDDDDSDFVDAKDVADESEVEGKEEETGESSETPAESSTPAETLETKEESTTEAVEGEGIGGEGKTETESKPEPAPETPAISLLTPVYTILLKIEYFPSKKDQQEKLYEMLNKVSKDKSQAIERLRKSAAIMTRIKATSAATTTTSDAKDPAVKSGFLKKKMAKKEKKPNVLVRMYSRFLGPESLTRALFPVVKNYFIFFGLVGFMHFKGDILALPAPL